MPSRRAVIAALLGGSVGAATLTDARGYLDRFAPLSGDAWGAATTDTRERVPTPYGEATVRYDDAGVPTVQGANDQALYFAVGYVHAADRLFEMDLIRRRMRGTLSAAVGERTVDSDRFHVQMDFASAAEASWRAVEDTPTGDAMRAYAAGVEAQRTSEPLPLEFRLLDYEPAAWTPVDSMLVEKQISWGLTGSFRSLQRSVAAEALGESAAATLYPERMAHDVPILRDEAAGERGRAADESAAAADGSGESDLASLSAWLADFESEPGIGSNSWLVSGEHTASGRPLLANDPHLTLMAPPVWYQMHQRRPGMRVRGVTFPGVPFVVIGENEAGAWGFTNAGADVLDVYTYETRDGEYRYGDEWRAFETEERTIDVAGGDDRTVTVRKSVHGPVLEREGERVGVAWTGLQASRTAIAVHELDRSGGREDALDALRKFDTPTQNAVYADRDGNTAYWVTGLIPVRESPGGSDDGNGTGGDGGDLVRGDRVFDGSAREGEWSGYEPYGEPAFETGWIPFEEKPGVRDPDYLATANQRIVDDPDSYLGEGYAAPFRARRIYDLLDERAASDDPFDFEYVRRAQRDVVDERARLFLPAIRDAREAMDDAARTAADRLEGWDYRMDRGSRAALVFELFVGHYRERVFDPVFEAAGLDESHYPNDWVLLTLGPERRWFADPPVEGVDARARRDVIAEAMADAVAEIDDEGYETYGDYNRTAIDHPFDLGFLNYPRLPTDGSPATVRNFRKESAVGSSFRLLARFDGDPSMGMIPGGNDGEYFSEHYSDLLEAWADAEYRPLVPTTEGDPAVRFDPDDSTGADGGASDE